MRGHFIVREDMPIYPEVKTDFDFSEMGHNKIGMEPPSNPGKGSKAEQHEYPSGKNKVGKVMHEYKEHTLKSSSGQKVTKRDQAVAIALSEQRQYEKKKRKS